MREEEKDPGKIGAIKTREGVRCRGIQRAGRGREGIGAEEGRGSNWGLSEENAVGDEGKKGEEVR